MSLLDIARPRGQHRAIDRVAQLERDLAQAAAIEADLRYRLAIATAGWDTANAKASQLRDVELRAAEATRQLQAQTAELYELRAFYANATKVSSLSLHPAVAETQPIPVLPLHLSPLAGVSPSHVPGL